MTNLLRKRSVLAVATAVTTAAASATVLLAPAMAGAPPQKPLPKMIITIPRDVLVFPADVTSGGGGDTSTTASPLTPSQKTTQDEVTNAFRDSLSRAGLGVVVYSKRLPSIQRAVAEGTIKAEQAAAGPGDDPRNALAFASAVGAAEFVTLDVSNYHYDPNTRTVTFNVSVQRNSAENNGAPIATVAKPAQGTAPADVPAARQEEEAIRYAADAVAEQSFQDLYPQVAQLQAAQQMKANQTKKKK